MGEGHKELMELLQRQEELHPDLLEWHETAEENAQGLEVVRHPLCYSVPHHESMNALVNRRYEFMLNQFEKARKSKKWAKMLAITERPHRLDMFIEHIGHRLSDAEYWEMLSGIYADTENPQQQYRTWHHALFVERKGTDSSTFMTPEERAFFKTLPETLTIYRGVGTAHTKGLSYTLDYDRAVWFARRFPTVYKNPHVVTCQVEKRHTLGYLSGRNEEEIVCDPKYLQNVTIEAL